MKIEKRIEELKELVTSESLLSTSIDRLSEPGSRFGVDMETKLTGEEVFSEPARRDRQFIEARQ
jgi:hypothetical protein